MWWGAGSARSGVVVWWWRDVVDWATAPAVGLPGAGGDYCGGGGDDQSACGGDYWGLDTGYGGGHYYKCGNNLDYYYNYYYNNFNYNHYHYNHHHHY